MLHEGENKAQDVISIRRIAESSTQSSHVVASPRGEDLFRMYYRDMGILTPEWRSRIKEIRSLSSVTRYCMHHHGQA